MRRVRGKYAEPQKADDLRLRRGRAARDGTQDEQPQGRAKRRRYANKNTKDTKGAPSGAIGQTIEGAPGGAQMTDD